MGKKLSVSSVVRSTGLYILLLGAIYIIGNACAASNEPPVTSAGAMTGILFLDSIPSRTGILHIHATRTSPDSASYGSQIMTEDSIPLLFYQITIHDTIDGEDYFGIYYSFFRTLHDDYAPGGWTINAAYVDNGSGAAWGTKILTVPSVTLPTPTHSYDTLNFVR